MTDILIPQPPSTRQIITHQPPHIDAEHTTRTTYNDGRHIHNRTVHHVDIHQPSPVLTTVAEETPPLVVRIPITEHVKVKVPRTIYRNEVREVERVEMVRQQREVPTTKRVPHERTEEYVEYEEREVVTKVKVPVTKQRRVVEQVEVASTEIVEEEVPIVHHDTITTPVEDTIYEDKILEVTTH